MRFLTNTSERMRIDNAGRLTITGQGLKLNATASSLYTLDGSLSYYGTTNAVYLNGAGTGGWLRLNASGAENNYNTINIQGGSAGNFIDMRTNNVERVRIDSSGRMGLGTASPKRLLHINGGNETVKIQITNTTTGSANDGEGFQLGIAANGDAFLEQRENLPLIFYTNNTERIRITSSGKFGIGESSPASNLVVKQSGSTFTTQSQTVALFQRSSTTGHGAKIAIVAGNASGSDINFGDTDDEDIGKIQYLHSDNSFRFTTNASERMVITSAGEVLINGLTVGRGAGAVATNTAVGTNALNTNNTGANNSAFGYNALRSNSTGNYNTAFGSHAAYYVTSSDNDAFGYYALHATTSGTNNCAIGRGTLRQNTTGGYNVALGYFALHMNQSADGNTAVGWEACKANQTGASNTGLGFRALHDCTSSNNVAVGYDSMRETTSGHSNTALGVNSLVLNTGGDGNTALGFKALNNNSTDGNTAVGYQALKDNSTHGACVAVGYRALEKSTAVQNTALGFQAAINVTTGNSNTAIGAYALDATTTASDCVAVGHSALGTNTTGEYNVAVGRRAAESLTTSGYSVAIGGLALSNATGQQNVSLGFQSGNNLTTGNYNAYLGSYTQASSTSVEKEIVLGYNIAGKGTRTFYVSADYGVYHAGNTTTWSTTSDRRIKKNIVDNNEGLSLINQIAVKNFEYKTAEEIESAGEVSVTDTVDKTGTQIGVIAQELQEVRSSWVTTRDNGTLAVTGSDEIIWHLVNAVKELSAKNAALEARIASLEA